MCGMGEVYEVAKAREAGIPVVFIDYRLGEASSGNPDEWFPIYPGTDGALASAIAYVIISEGKHDKEFLDKYTVGFDADTMPEGAPENSSYMDYIMGTGYDNDSQDASSGQLPFAAFLRRKSNTSPISLPTMKRVSSRKASDRSATITANGTLPPSRRCPSSPETSANPAHAPA